MGAARTCSIRYRMQGTHILPLTGIRFFAAGWVVLCHLGALFISLLPILEPFRTFFSLGYFAVSLFFLLSGFILSHNYFATYTIDQHHKFLFLRFARLWPVHFAALVLMLIYTGASSYPLSRLLEELIMIHSWFRADLGLNYPAWSISAEWFAYIFLFPIAFLSFIQIRSVPLLVVIETALLTAAAFVPAHALLGRGGEIIFLFPAGSALYRLRSLQQIERPEWIQNSGLLLVFIYVVFHGALPRFTIFAGFAALVFGLSYQRGFLARLLSGRRAVLGGLASYSQYMTHAVVGKVYGLFTGSLPPQPVFVRVLLFLILVIALCSATLACYHCVEEPATKVLRRLAGKSKAHPNRSGRRLREQPAELG
jgi:peptidoglycan/LPS O-acetylase OafA/YrhL